MEMSSKMSDDDFAKLRAAAEKAKAEGKLRPGTRPGAMVVSPLEVLELLDRVQKAEARVAELEADRDSWKTLAEGHCVDHLQAHEIAAELEEARAAIERVRKVVNCSCGRCVAFRGGGMHTNGPCELTPRNLNDALKGAE